MTDFNATCIANPNTVRKMVLKGDCSAERIREIVAPLSPKLLLSSLINKMINELAAYQIQSNKCLWSDMKDKEVLENIIEFWSERNSLPTWRELAHPYYLLQPTSASLERAFSMLKYIYTDQQSLSMVDLIKTTLMLRYNKD